MKKFLLVCGALFISAWGMGADKSPSPLKANFIEGSPTIRSMNALAFGPEGVLFVGDSRNARIFAIDTQDEQAGEATEIKIQQFDEVVADVLGTTADKIAIQDIAVNPISKVIYFSVHHNDGTPLLLKVVDNEIKTVPLENIKFSEVRLNDPVAEDAKDRRGRELRIWAVSDLSYHNGSVLVSGLSNQEFSSTFRSIPFPFTGKQEHSSLEVYHAAHGQFETFAPIKAFTATEVNNEPHLIASYTCTPLVVFPMNQLKPGEHVKGRTVAELGNWNTPLDIITLEKEGRQYILIANSNRALMKIKVSDIASFRDALTTPVKERAATAGVDFIALPFVNVQQLAKLDDSQFVVLQRKASGSLDLFTPGNRWL